MLLPERRRGQGVQAPCVAPAAGAPAQKDAKIHLCAREFGASPPLRCVALALPWPGPGESVPFAPTLKPLCPPARVTFPVAETHTVSVRSTAEVNQT